MAATAVEGPELDGGTVEPTRTLCDCGSVILVVELGREVVIAEAFEWEPRARCYVCATIAARGQTRRNCDRCGGSGYVGERRPPGRALAIDVAWSDEGHVPLGAPRPPRRRGEALYALHACGVALAG
jgi:hypothetical protein